MPTLTVLVAAFALTAHAQELDVSGYRPTTVRAEVEVIEAPDAGPPPVEVIAEGDPGPSLASGKLEGTPPPADVALAVLPPRRPPGEQRIVVGREVPAEAGRAALLRTPVNQ